MPTSNDDKERDNISLSGPFITVKVTSPEQALAQVLQHIQDIQGIRVHEVEAIWLDTRMHDKPNSGELHYVRCITTAYRK